MNIRQATLAERIDARFIRAAKDRNSGVKPETVSISERERIFAEEVERLVEQRFNERRVIEREVSRLTKIVRGKEEA